MKMTVYSHACCFLIFCSVFFWQAAHGQEQCSGQNNLDMCEHVQKCMGLPDHHPGSKEMKDYLLGQNGKPRNPGLGAANLFLCQKIVNGCKSGEENCDTQSFNHLVSLKSKCTDEQVATIAKQIATGRECPPRPRGDVSAGPSTKRTHHTLHCIVYYKRCAFGVCGGSHKACENQSVSINTQSGAACSFKVTDRSKAVECFSEKDTGIGGVSDVCIGKLYYRGAIQAEKVCSPIAAFVWPKKKSTDAKRILVRPKIEEGPVLDGKFLKLKKAK